MLKNATLHKLIYSLLYLIVRKNRVNIMYIENRLRYLDQGQLTVNGSSILGTLT